MPLSARALARIAPAVAVVAIVTATSLAATQSAAWAAASTTPSSTTPSSTTTSSTTTSSTTTTTVTPTAGKGGSEAKKHAAESKAAGNSTVPAYYVDASNGGVFTYGGARFYGSAGDIHLNKPVVGMATTPSGDGYWLVASDGGVFTYGGAGFYGSTGSMRLNKPVVGMAPTPDGRGYWLVAADGGIFTFGDAGFYGSTGSMRLNKPVVGMAPTPDGRGYWLVAADGGIFTFGDARFFGSTGGMRLNAPVIGMAATPDGDGYWLVAADGGVFTFGNAGFHGSMGGVRLASPVTGVTPTPDGGGYWFTSAGGTVFAFGDAGYFGSASDSIAPVVGMSEAPGSGYASHSTTYPSGAYGEDVSNWQCGESLPSGHAIGIVEVAGWSFGAVNPCLAEEASWAGAGLELYLFVSYGTDKTGPSICGGSLQCNFGYGAAQHVYEQAKSAGIDADVTWWLDVEESKGAWTSSGSDNSAVVRGALLGLQQEGLSTVGIYSNHSEWTSVTSGSGYSPDVPEWVAEWGTNEPPFDPQTYCQGYNFANGPTWIIQYTDGAHTSHFDSDYAC